MSGDYLIRLRPLDSIIPALYSLRQIPQIKVNDHAAHSLLLCLGTTLSKTSLPSLLDEPLDLRPYPLHRHDTPSPDTHFFSRPILQRRMRLEDMSE